MPSHTCTIYELPIELEIKLYFVASVLKTYTYIQPH